jgi:hypothetical protein
MGVGQIYYFILIPKSDKNPSPPAFSSKKAWELQVFDFLRPKDWEKLWDPPPPVNSIHTFFSSIFLGATPPLGRFCQ